jgi:peroxiredoxin Q/BCP
MHSPVCQRARWEWALACAKVLLVLKVGQQAPAFDVSASDGKRIQLEDFRGKKNVVLYFYPRDFTRVCTQEACGFRDMYEELRGQDAEVIGVSLDSDDSHKKFAVEFKLPFPLVADKNRSIAKSYEVIDLFRGLLGIVKRITFVIDKQGNIAQIFHAELSADAHLEGVRVALAKLAP